VIKGFLLVPFVGALYSLFFGLLPATRREGISGRFFLESLSLTAIASTLGVLGICSIHPVIFLLATYLITMRVRLFLDLGSALARRGRMESALSAYAFAARLWPDQQGALLVLINQAACSLRRGNPQAAIPQLEQVLVGASEARLGLKYLAACHYNLGLAYWRVEKKAQARGEFQTVMDIWPLSSYARRAEDSLVKMGEGA
jgi:tetratricopeptide (TPR) repeat protein